MLMIPMIMQYHDYFDSDHGDGLNSYLKSYICPFFNNLQQSCDIHEHVQMKSLDIIAFYYKI